MHDPLGSNPRRPLAERGFTRRDLGKFAALLTAGASLPFYNESTLAQGLSAMAGLTPDTVMINANENPMGPCPEAIEAINGVVARGGRYLYGETNEFVRTLAGVEGLSPEMVLPFAGSSDPLHRAVIAFTSPTKSFVIADPGYEAGEKAARLRRRQGPQDPPEGRRLARRPGDDRRRPQRRALSTSATRTTRPGRSRRRKTSTT